MRAQFADITFDSDTREVTRRGEPLHLSPKAFQLLHILLEKRPNAAAKEELMERLWPDVFVEEANLKNLVVEIRRVLGQPHVIRTIRGFGYAFAGATTTSPAPAGGRLVGSEGVYRLRSGEHIIGRGASCSIVVEMPGVSRHHARIVVSESGEAQVEDLGSKNGTWVNGVRLIGPAPLNAGDQIEIGVTRFVYRPASQEDSTVTLEVGVRS